MRGGIETTNWDRLPDEFPCLVISIPPFQMAAPSSSRNDNGAQDRNRPALAARCRANGDALPFRFLRSLRSVEMTRSYYLLS
ncbi:MAG TPA: hypothetical protein ENN32_03075 [Chloroflexi bacterium]|nr:hypothetical protein [Chloroflexota bacterium]